MIGASFSPVGAALRFDPCEVNKFGYRNMSRRPWRAISEIGDEQACLQSYDHRKVWNQSSPCLYHMKEDSLSLMPGRCLVVLKDLMGIQVIWNTIKIT